ncbi:hypothetical protein LR48_Vigan09g007500 [Vigna angularis]|uniref:Uncharacterized protein n=1 Tax=Phaseolus angularis TaxID=3914 RepID=A0A0L9V8L5_PHAAN|nr:hypothetical protein LR48_Vigan09g007500 [Vigna angularis]
MSFGLCSPFALPFGLCSPFALPFGLYFPSSLLDVVRLKRRKCDGEKHNFMERLLGAARLLAEMVEPILKAASYPSATVIL